jgi:hypothetical protein
MLTKTKIAFAAALVFGTASAALAGARDEDVERGGFVVPCSLEGVNPALHPDIFGNAATAYAFGFVRSRGALGRCDPTVIANARPTMPTGLVVEDPFRRGYDGIKTALAAARGEAVATHSTSAPRS